MDMLTSGPTYL